MSFLRALGFRGGVDKRKAERAASQALLERGSPGKISLSGALLLKCFWKPVRLGLCGCWSTVISLQKASNMKSITPGCVSPPVSGSFFLVVLVNSQDSSFPFKIKKYISIYLAVRAQLHTQDLHCIVVSAAHAGSSLHRGLNCTCRIFTASWSQLHTQDLHCIVHNLLLLYTHLQLWAVDSRVRLTSFSGPWHVGSFPPNQGRNLHPLHCKGTTKAVPHFLLF